MNAQNAGGLEILLINGRKDWENDMEVYIKGMSKPKRCIEELDYGLLDNPCLFVDERGACLLQSDSKIGEYEENYKTCPLIEIVECKDCRHVNECHKSVQYTRNEPNSVTIGYSRIEWCSHGERRADDR